MTNCSFCSDYKWMRKRSRKDNEKHNKNPDRTFNLRSKFEVTIVENTYRYGGNHKYIKSAGRSTSGRYPIRYCPMCGRELKR